MKLKTMSLVPSCRVLCPPPPKKKMQRRNQFGKPTKERREKEKWQIKEIRVELTHRPFLRRKGPLHLLVKLILRAYYLTTG